MRRSEYPFSNCKGLEGKYLGAPSFELMLNVIPILSNVSFIIVGKSRTNNQGQGISMHLRKVVRRDTQTETKIQKKSSVQFSSRYTTISIVPLVGKDDLFG